MTNEIIDNKLENFFSGKFVQDTIKLSIIKLPDGSYILFDKYTISISDNKFLIHDINGEEVNYFHSLQNAVTWCIYQQKHKFSESTRIEVLDKMIEGINFSINMLKNMIRKTANKDNVLIYVAKLSEDEAKRHKFIKELSKYKDQAKYWQFRKLGARG